MNPLSGANALELLEIGVTQPKNILKQLEINLLPTLTAQINNLKQRPQHKPVGPLTCLLSRFLLWFKKRENVPEDEDEVYVVSYDYKLSKRRKIIFFSML